MNPRRKGRKNPGMMEGRSQEGRKEEPLTVGRTLDGRKNPRRKNFFAGTLTWLRRLLVVCGLGVGVRFKVKSRHRDGRDETRQVET